MHKKQNLFGQFPPVSTEEWMQKITTDLKGADFGKLIWKNAGIEIMPFYREEDLDDLIAVDSLPCQFPFRRGSKTGNNWLIRQDIRVRNYNEANAKALDILMKGVESLGFIIQDPSSVSRQNMQTLLSGIDPEAVELNFLCNGMAKEILGAVLSICSEKGLEPSQIRGAIEADPLGRLMLNGTLCIPVEDGFNYLADLTKDSAKYRNFRTIHINASSLGNSGADAIQELAFAISMGNEYMSQLTSRGLDCHDSASKIRFSFGIGSDYFVEIAKLRAARMLWSVVMKGYCDNDFPEIEIHSVTSCWNKTIYDPYVNMLRTQTEAMSAALGGANSITVIPFDTFYSEPDAFSERIARNQQLILKEEAGFDKIADPSAGSYYIEKLTDLISELAWKIFIETEEQGGFLAALKNGLVQKCISKSASKKKKDVSTRKTILLGTNQYPNTREKTPVIENSESIFGNNNAVAKEVEPVKPFRGASEYEKIRLAVEKSGRRPHVFLFTIGDQVKRKARAQFSSVFFSCGGYRVTDNNGFDSIDAGVKAAIESAADIAVICSSDEEYATLAPLIYKNLKDHFIVVVAGNPACLDDLKVAGLEYFIHMKSDVTEILKHFNLKLGINPLG
ncbi:MAG TPA: methylmalonyl-CoA mutase family protein [Bacteroidales bacterium]|nr:methylmalonyl-CoA mutase family protein [Bacteroidales bacterium]